MVWMTDEQYEKLAKKVLVYTGFFGVLILPVLEPYIRLFGKEHLCKKCKDLPNCEECGEKTAMKSFNG